MGDKEKNLELWNRFLFRLLCFLEIFYRVFFDIVLFGRKYLGNRRISGVKVLSIGNLSVGGTGKTLLVELLIKKIKKFNGAIICRGYKAEAENLSYPILVDINRKQFPRVELIGDEAFYHAISLKVPVAVGKNRFYSAFLLSQTYNLNEKPKKIDYFVIDDGYQNFQIKVDLNILLLDGRAPLGNGHCLPAGNLREKDLSRANIIVFTHSDEVPSIFLANFISKKLKNFPPSLIFKTIHKVNSLLHGNGDLKDKFFLKGKKVFAFAGIGSFNSFLYSLEKLGVQLFRYVKFEDHYSYDLKDVIFILDFARNLGCSFIVTTMKDWVKIKPILKGNNLPLDLFYIVKVELAFDSSEEEKRFFQLIENIF